jgi:hypothetical protein
MGKKIIYKNSKNGMPTRIVHKYTNQLYTVLVNDIVAGELILIREHLPSTIAYEAFYGFIKHFEVLGELRKTRRVECVRNNQYSITIKKERRRRLL